MTCWYCNDPMAFEWQTFESQARGQWCCRRCGESVKQHDPEYVRPSLAWFVSRVDGSSGLRVREQLERHYRGLLTETEVEMIVRAAWHRWHQGISLRMAREHEIRDHGGALRCTCGWQFAPADAEWQANATYIGPDLGMRGRVRVLAPGVIEFWRGNTLHAASGVAAGDYELDDPELDEAERKALASEFLVALEALAG